MNNIDSRFNAKAIARLILSKKKAGIRVLRVPQKASPARGVRVLLSYREESAMDALLRETSRQENAALVFPDSWAFIKQARARKSVRRARMVRSLGALAACLVIAAAGIFYYRAQYAPKAESAPMEMAADSAAESNDFGDIMTDEVQEQALSSPLCAAAPSQTSAPEMFTQENAVIPDAGNSRSTGSSDSADSAGLALGEIVSYEIRMIGEALPVADAQSLRGDGLTVEYGINSPVALLPGEAAVCTRDDGSLSLYYLYNDQDTLLLTMEGADEEALFTYAQQLSQAG